MGERRRATIEDLSRAIECLPRATRIAMLEGIESNEIIVGAYSADGGICPMLAAHRAGGRTDAISFARVRELRARLGWAWTRIVRTHDDYERVLEHVAGGHDDAHGREPTAV